MPEQVIVTIGPDGKAVVEVQGCRGPSCQQLTRALEQALGHTTSDVKKPEFLQAQATGIALQASGGTR